MANRLTSAELAEFRQQLEAREAQLVRELEAGRDKDAGDSSFGAVASEVPDSGDASVADLESDLTHAERERDSDELREVQAALTRLETGTFGVCMECGEPISRERLKAEPTAHYDAEHAAERERRSGGVKSATL